MRCPGECVEPRIFFGRRADRAIEGVRRSSPNQLLPGSRYALAALEALSPTALNSAPVQALAVVMCEIAPAAAAAINAAIMFSASLASEMSRKSEPPVVK
jgi:hypothetical protein